MSIKLLSSGYWHVRWSLNQFAQWPKGTLCTLTDIFPAGWATQTMVDEANALAEKSRA